MGKGKAVLALLVVIAVIAASPLVSQATAAASASVVGTRMKISSRALTFNALRCVAIPASGGNRSVQVTWQQGNKTACTEIQFFNSSKCTGKTVDTLAQGEQRSTSLSKAVKSARCIIAASNTTASASNTTASASNTTASASNTTASASNTTASASNTTASASNTTASASNTTASASNTTASTNSTTPASDAESSSTSKCSNGRVNPCNGGTCIDRGAEHPTCVCRPNHLPVNNDCDGADCFNCREDWMLKTSVRVMGSDWSCKDVYTMYGLTLQQFTDLNPVSPATCLAEPSRFPQVCVHLLSMSCRSCFCAVSFFHHLSPPLTLTPSVSFYLTSDLLNHFLLHSLPLFLPHHSLTIVLSPPSSSLIPSISPYALLSPSPTPSPSLTAPSPLEY
ncbi:unnamed protein product [Closterium sp. Yama58-4]|nr:unnamed protein product [Closterium sp. Yama58-4]